HDPRPRDADLAAGSDAGVDRPLLHDLPLVARSGARTRTRLTPPRILRVSGRFHPVRTISSPRRSAPAERAGRSSAGVIVVGHPASLCTFRETRPDVRMGPLPLLGPPSAARLRIAMAARRCFRFP